MIMRRKIAILADSPIDALRTGAQGRGAGRGAPGLPPLAEAFAAYDDLDITWIALEQNLAAKIDERRHGQRFIALPHIKKTYDTVLNYLPARLRLKNEIRKLQPDVIHVWGSEHYYPSVLPGLKIPSVYSIQGNMTRYAIAKPEPLLTEVSNFVAAVRGDRSADVVTLEEAVATVRIAEALRESAMSGENIRMSS